MRTLLPRARRSRLLLTGAAAFALAAAGAAIANHGGPASTSLVSATFFANTLARSHSETCTPTPPGDAYTITDVVFTGTASSADPRFAGPITIHAKSVYDTTKNVGSLKGDASIDNGAQPGHFHARLDAVNVNGTVQGWLTGDLGDGTHFMGSFTSTFSPTGGFSSSGAPGSIGSGTGTNTAIVWSGSCEPPHVDNGHHHDNNNDKHHDKHHHD